MMPISYRKQLDNLRFLAVLLVLIEHAAHPFGNLFLSGYFGVDLFFVISGFLITGKLLESETGFRNAYLNFIGRRVLRIVPAYYLLLLVLFLLGTTSVKTYWMYCISYTYNYAMVHFNVPENAITHFWSLCVEEQFYLLWPLLVLPFRKQKSLLFGLMLLVVCLSYAQFYFKIIPALSRYTWVGILSQSYALGIGALGAVYFYGKKETTISKMSSWTELLLFFSLCYLLWFRSALTFIGCPLIALILVLKSFHAGFKLKPLNWFISNNLFSYLGKISYGIYLYHLPVYYFSRKHFYGLHAELISMKYSWLMLFFLCSSISIVLAATSYRFLETPFLRWKDRFFKYEQV